MYNCDVQRIYTNIHPIYTIHIVQYIRITYKISTLPYKYIKSYISSYRHVQHVHCTDYIVITIINGIFKLYARH